MSTKKWRLESSKRHFFSCWGSIGIFSVKDKIVYGIEYDGQVQPERPILNVKVIQPYSRTDLIRLLDFPPIAHYLGKPCNARFDFVTGVVLFNQLFKCLIHGHGVGSRAHNRHVSHKHVEELRHFIQGISPQKRAKPCYPWIVSFGLMRIRIVIGGHRAKLDTFKYPIIFPISILNKENRPFGLELDQQTY